MASFDDIGDIFVNGLGRVVDNATASEPQPSPNSQTGADQNVVTTNNNGTGVAKAAGTGQILLGVPNNFLFLGVGGIVVLTGLLLLVRK